MIIRGGERIEWDQPVDSPQVAAGYTFTLYVDGSMMPLSDARCASVRSAGGVICSGRLPTMAQGAHTLELTASAGSVESSRSRPLRVTVSSLAVVSGGALDTAQSLAAAGERLVCLETAAMDCYDARLLTSLRGEIASPLAASERVFFVEGDARVGAIVGNAPEPIVALTVVDGARIEGLAIPRDFESSRLVFVAWSERSGDGHGVLHITRYRELQGALGEAATIVTGLPLTQGERAPIAIDREGLVYVALPASGAEATPSPEATSGLILRYAPDGGVAAGNPRSSPVIAYGYAHPASLVWDDVARALWLSGSDSRWPTAVSTLRVDVDGQAAWPWLPAAVPSTAGVSLSHGFPLLALTPRGPILQARRLWLVPGSGGVQPFNLGPAQLLRRLGATGFDQIGPVVGVADGPGEGLTVVTRMPSSSGSISSLWRLTPTRSVKRFR